MVSTPSRSRQATRISLPAIVGPSSTLLAAGAFFLVSVVLLICSAVVAGGRRCIKKPTAVCQPWVLVETQFTFDKRRRRRQLRRRPAEPLVEYSLSLRRM